MASTSEHAPGDQANFIANFFAKHPPFQYNPNEPPTSEFKRLCTLFRSEGPAFRKTAKEEFQDALTLQFNSIYGTDVNSLQAWQGLCHVLNIAPVPAALNECRQLVRNTHVNLVDLVHTPASIRIFPTLEELVAYTVNTEKYFPKENAMAGGVLKYLLRPILNPYNGQREDGRGRGRRGGRGRQRGRASGT